MSPQKAAETVVRCNPGMVIDLYHEVLPELPKVMKKRWKGSVKERDLRARWREDEAHQSPKFWRAFFETVRENPHWMGKNEREWRADLAWLLKRANFDKVYQLGHADA